MKICKKCNEVKELVEFVKNKECTDGTTHTCKDCHYKKKNSIRHEATLTERTCSICKEIKKAEFFHKNKGVVGGLHCSCKECTNKSQIERGSYKISGKKRNERRAIDPEFREKLKKQGNDSRKRNITTQLLNSCRVRALEKGWEFNITKEDIVIPEICPILLVPIKCGNKKDYSNSPSVDRINNNKGYIKGNVQVISKKANTIKNNATQEELLLFANWVNKTFKS